MGDGIALFSSRHPAPRLVSPSAFVAAPIPQFVDTYWSDFGHLCMPDSSINESALEAALIEVRDGA